MPLNSMPHQITNNPSRDELAERVLHSAKEEFLEKGFVHASLRHIVAKAGTTTMAIYSRFRNKEALFKALVNPVVEAWNEMFIDSLKHFDDLPDEKKEVYLMQTSHTPMLRLLDFVYEHFETFQLLLDASYGTVFETFFDHAVDLEVEYTLRYMEAIGVAEQYKDDNLTMLLHILASSFFSGFFEVVRHEMTYRQAKAYVERLQVYHQAGFDTIFHPERYDDNGQQS
jgi:AcrR family transcriptional regulator